MFTERLPDRDASVPAHLARMVALMGAPPKGLLSKSVLSKNFFDEEGRCLIAFL